MADYRAFLKKVPLFAALPPDDLEHLCAAAREFYLEAGEQLFQEGSLDQYAYVIIEGKIEIYKRSGSREVQLAVRLPGEVIGELTLLEDAPRIASGRALVRSRLLEVGRASFETLFDTHPGAARAMLHTVIGRLRATELALQQNERLAQLGMFSAGLAHELNNPAAAVRRGAGQMSEVVALLCEAQLAFADQPLSGEQIQRLRGLARRGPDGGGLARDGGGLDEADRVERLETWFDARRIELSADFVPVLAARGFDPVVLEDLLRGFSAPSAAAAVHWLGAVLTLQSLAAEIGEGAARMSEIVRALKSYVYLDQGPVQAIDVREGLENTLILMRHRLKGGVSIERSYAADLPKIQAYGSELNQVWTNLIDNAIDALHGSGKITIQAEYEAPWVVVQIEDNGPGIAPEDLDRLFNPFFTTKPPGQGTGLGLHTSYNILQRHGADIQVRSQPGQTIFEVRLPLEFDHQAHEPADSAGQRGEVKNRLNL